MNEINEIIVSYNEYIRQIPKGVYYIAERLREDKLTEAFQTIKDFSEGVIWLSEVSQLLRENNVQVLLAVDQIQDFLVEINEGLEKQDFVLVADIFEYEIAPFFEELIPINVVD